MTEQDRKVVNRPIEQSDTDFLWDAVIIGAGPAGSVCARQLAAKSYKVLLIDKEPFPRHKPCGDLLIPDALELLKRLNLLAPIESHALELHNLAVHSPSGVKSKNRVPQRGSFSLLLS